MVLGILCKSPFDYMLHFNQFLMDKSLENSIDEQIKSYFFQFRMPA